MNTNQQKICIARGAAVGTALGYAVTLRFGIITGMIVGIISAIIASDLHRFIRAQREARHEFGGLKKACVNVFEGVCTDLEEKLGPTISKGILYGMKVGAIGALILMTLCSAKNLWNQILPILYPKWDIDLTHGLLWAAFFGCVLGGLFLIALLTEEFDVGGEIRISGKLSWPLLKTCIDKMVYCRRMLEKMMAHEKVYAYFIAIDNTVGKYLEAAAIMCYQKDRKETSVDSKVVVLICGICLLVFTITFLLPILFIPIALLSVVLLGLLVLDLALMIAVRCATTAAMGAGIGAAVAIFLEYRMYPEFSVHSAHDWIRFIIFMGFGSAVGIGNYALRQALLVRKLEWI
jgi:tetrahydromethanopterin S-methyltransferase subunit G